MPRWLIAASLLIAACAFKDDDDDDDDDDWDDSGSEHRDSGGEDNGAELFASQCAACHGAGGTGVVGPSLVMSIPTLTDGEIRIVLKYGTGAMPSPSLSSNEENAVFQYLRDRFGNYGSQSDSGGEG